MDEKLKKDLKKLAAEGEMRIARSLLRWKFKKEGKRIPTDDQLDDSSRKIADQAHQMLASSSKKAWHEIKKAYQKKSDERAYQKKSDEKAHQKKSDEKAYQKKSDEKGAPKA